MRTYATPAELTEAGFHGEPAEAARVLEAATPIIENLTKTAVYTVDAAGLPTDPEIAAAFKGAAIAQALHFEETGDISGVAAGYSSISLGNFSMSTGTGRTGNGVGAADRRTSLPAVEILAAAGLIAQAPR